MIVMFALPHLSIPTLLRLLAEELLRQARPALTPEERLELDQLRATQAAYPVRPPRRALATR